MYTRQSRDHKLFTSSLVLTGARAPSRLASRPGRKLPTALCAKTPITFSPHPSPPTPSRDAAMGHRTHRTPPPQYFPSTPPIDSAARRAAASKPIGQSVQPRSRIPRIPRDGPRDGRSSHRSRARSRSIAPSHRARAKRYETSHRRRLHGRHRRRRTCYFTAPNPTAARVEVSPGRVARSTLSRSRRARRPRVSRGFWFSARHIPF